MASGRRIGQRPNCHTFLCKFWHFQMAVSQWKLAWLTPNLGILWISMCSFWLWESIVANPIIYRLVPKPSRFETRQCFDRCWRSLLLTIRSFPTFVQSLILSICPNVLKKKSLYSLMTIWPASHAPFQPAYRSCHSTESALMNMHNHIMTLWYHWTTETV